MFTVPMAVLLLLHTPPPVTSLKGVVLPSHTINTPVIGARVEGSGLTVITNVAAALPQLLVIV